MINKLEENNLISQKLESALEQSPENLQSDWEELIIKAMESGKEETKDIGTIELPNGKSFEEKLIVKPGCSGPEVGAKLEGEGETFVYSCRCFKSRMETYGEIMAADPHILVRHKEGRSALIPVSMTGNSIAKKLSERYDKYIVQAVSNVLNERVLHPIVVGYDRLEKDRYLNSGYNARKDDEQVVDKIYNPKIKKK